MASIPHPHVEDLLPPFLAHIPVAFSSSQPPPSLLPLLAPILRSRVTLLSGPSSDSVTGLSSPADSWLSHLTWSASGTELCESLAQQDFSPHPSGEFEIGEYEFKGIRRIDEETIKSRVELPERGIEVDFLWVKKSNSGGFMGAQTSEDMAEGEGWKIVDVKLIKTGTHEEEEKWYPTVATAEEGFQREREALKQQKLVKETQLVTSPPTNSYLSLQPTASNHQFDDEDEDDSYWDMYDRSPARTPAVQHQTHIQTEDEYYSRYSGVEPALDKGDSEAEPVSGRVWYTAPSAHPSHDGTSQQSHAPLQGSIIQTSQAPSAFVPFLVPMSPPTSSPSKPASLAPSTPPQLPMVPVEAKTITTEIKAPSPKGSPRAGSPSASVSALEELAAKQMQAETGVKQHISTTIKSLFRMARVVGMEREEFERVVKTELEILGMVEDEESGGSGSW